MRGQNEDDRFRRPDKKGQNNSRRNQKEEEQMKAMEKKTGKIIGFLS